MSCLRRPCPCYIPILLLSCFGLGTPCTCSCMVKRRPHSTHSRLDVGTWWAAGQNVPTEPLTNKSWIWVTRETNVYHGMVTKKVWASCHLGKKEKCINFLILFLARVIRRYHVLNSVFRQVYWQKSETFYRFPMKYNIFMHNTFSYISYIKKWFSVM